MARSGFLIALITILLFACAPAPSVPVAGFVDLEYLEPLPTPVVAEVLPLRVAIAAVISPQGSADSYQPLLEYLSQELGRPVEAVQRRTYVEVNELIRLGEVDLAFVCTSSYVVGRREFGMQLLAAPQVHGEQVYRAQIIVPAESPATRIDDLRGSVFAFTDPLSLTGRMYPTYQLQQMGETPDSFFARTFFTYGHDDAVRAVAGGMADGASIDALVLDFALKRDPELAARVRVIHTSAPFGIPPVVIGPELRPQLRAQLADVLLKMHLDSKGQEALSALDYDRFVSISARAYDTAQEVEQATRPVIQSSP